MKTPERIERIVVAPSDDHPGLAYVCFWVTASKPVLVYLTEAQCESLRHLLGDLHFDPRMSGEDGDT